MQLKLISLLLLLLISIGKTNAQSVATDAMVCEKGGCCCGNDPTPAGVMISHVHLKNEWMISYRFMGMNMSGTNSGTERISQDKVLNSYFASPTLMQMNMHML